MRNYRRGNKYRAIRCEVDGIKFDSKMEARRYQELKVLEKAGEIRQLRLQPPYLIAVNGQKICRYVADFCYLIRTPEGFWTVVVEDCKGVKTPVYRLKKKMMRAILGIEVSETHELSDPLYSRPRIERR